MIDGIFLIALLQSGLAGELEVTHLVRQVVAPDVGESRVIFRKLAGIAIATMANHARSQHKFLAPPIQIRRGKQLPIRSKDQEADDGRLLFTPGLTM